MPLMQHRSVSNQDDDDDDDAKPLSLFQRIQEVIFIVLFVKQHSCNVLCKQKQQHDYCGKSCYVELCEHFKKCL